LNANDDNKLLYTMMGKSEDFIWFKKLSLSVFPLWYTNQKKHGECRFFSPQVLKKEFVPATTIIDTY